MGRNNAYSGGTHTQYGGNSSHYGGSSNPFEGATWEDRSDSGYNEEVEGGGGWYNPGSEGGGEYVAPEPVTPQVQHHVAPTSTGQKSNVFRTQGNAEENEQGMDVVRPKSEDLVAEVAPSKPAGVELNYNNAVASPGAYANQKKKPAQQKNANTAGKVEYEETSDGGLQQKWTRHDQTGKPKKGEAKASPIPKHVTKPNPATMARPVENPVMPTEDERARLINGETGEVWDGGSAPDAAPNDYYDGWIMQDEADEDWNPLEGWTDDDYANPEAALRRSFANRANEAASKSTQRPGNVNPNARVISGKTANEILKPETDSDRMYNLLSKYRRNATGVDQKLDELGYNVDELDAWAERVLDPTADAASIGEESRRRAAETRFASEFLSGDFNIEGSHLSKENGQFVVRYDDDTEIIFSTICKMFGWDPVTDAKYAYQLLRVVLGYGADRDLRVFEGDDRMRGRSNKEVFKEFVNTGFTLIQRSMDEAGHPFAFTMANIENPFGGHPRFPVGIIPNELAEALVRPGSMMEGHNVKDVIEAGRKATVNSYKYLNQYATANGREDVVKSWEDMARALCRISDIDCEEFGIAAMGGKSFSKLYHDNVMFRDKMHQIDPEHADALADYDLNVIEQAFFDRTSLAQGRIEKRKNSKTAIGSDKGKLGDEIATFGLSAWRTVHIAGNVPLMATSVVEQGKGLAEVALFNKAQLGNSKYNIPLDAWKDYGKKKDFLDAANAVQTLIQVDGGRRDLLMAFCATGRPMTTKNVQDFIQTTLPDASSPKIRELTQKMQRISDAIMVGDLATAEPFAKTLIQSFMVEQKRIGSNIDGETMMNALQTNPTDVFTGIAASDQFWQAYHRTTNTTYKRVSPATVALKTMLADKGGMADLLTTFVFNAPFFTYGMQVMEAWIPFSNTAEYIISYIAGSSMVKSGKMSPAERKALLENSIGGLAALSDEQKPRFLQGVKLCMQYDGLRFGSTALQALFHLSLIMLLGGLQPPDDDEDPTMDAIRKNDYRFWKVPNPFTKEHEPIYMSWFLDDITQWSVPAAIGIGTAIQTGDWGRGATIAINGGLDMLGSNRCLQGLQAITDLGKSVLSGEGFKPEFDVAKEVEARVLKIFSDPMLISQVHDLLHEGDLERDVFKDIYGNNRGDREAQLNSFALQNDLAGWILNRFTGGKYGWEGSALRSEHDEDDEAAAKSNSFEAFKANGGTDMAGYYEFVKGLLENYDTTADAAAAGVRITKYDASLLGSYINELNSMDIKRLNDLAQNDPSQYYQVKDSVWAAVNSRNSWKSDLFYDNIIYDPAEYNVLYNSQVKLRDGNGGYKYVDYGDHPSQGLLWTTPSQGDNDTDKDGNKEHQFRDVFITPTEAEGNYGDYRTEKYTNDGRTADGRMWIPKNEKYGNLTQDQWKRLRQEGYTEEEIRKISGGKGADLTPEQIAELAAQGYNSEDYANLPFDKQCEIDAAIAKKAKQDAGDKAAASKSTSNGSSWSRSGGGYSYKSYSSGGGSSNYNPKIYNMKGGSLSVNKPANMYTKSPYSANKNYLSPDFSTKGSREAYKRSEY